MDVGCLQGRCFSWATYMEVVVDTGEVHCLFNEIRQVGRKSFNTF